MRSEGQFDRLDVVSIVARLNDEMAKLKKHNSLLIKGVIKVVASNEKIQFLVAINLLIVICVFLVLIWK